MSDKQLIHSANYTGQLKAPPSKSFMQRAIAIALLAEGETILNNYCRSNDSRAALKMAEDLGATITISENSVSIIGSNGIRSNTLSAGESGLGIRCFVPIASLFDEEINFTGKGSLVKRPLSMLEQPLIDLGAQIKTKNGYLPLSVHGPIRGGELEVDGSISSQVLTGLLIALPKAVHSSKIKVKELNSIPYIDMTLQIMKHFGVSISHDNYELFQITGGQSYQGRAYIIEGDWSNAAFHLVGAAISGSIRMTNLNLTSTQADRKIIEALEKVGTDIEYETDTIKVSKNKLKAFQFDATHCPDLFPPLSNLAAQCEGTSIITGVKRLTHKESNRALALQKEWAKLGININILNDEMHITGGTIQGGTISSHNDHRIAMMGAIAGLKSKEPVLINGAEAVGKSYPGFFEDFLQMVGSE